MNTQLTRVQHVRGSSLNRVTDIHEDDIKLFVTITKPLPRVHVHQLEARVFTHTSAPLRQMLATQLNHL